MKSEVEELFYLLREGSTSEEQWTWEELGDMCSSGELSPGSQVYLREKDRWMRLEETDLAERFSSVEDEETDEEREALDEEYERARQNLNEQPESIDFLIDAGRLASDLGDHEAARRYFQNALDLKPYHGRVAQEVARCFTPAECARMRLLRRPDSISDDLTAPLNYALARGPLYLAVPFVVFAALSFVPGGVWASVPLAVLWCFQMVKRVGQNDSNPPLWQHAAADPVGELVIPLAGFVGSTLTLFAVFYGVARLVMLVDREVAHTTIEYIARSPILAVAFVVLFVGYMPAVVMWILHSRSGIVSALNPMRTFGIVSRAGGEYAMTVVALLGIAFLVGLAYATLGGLPVAGKLITAAALSFALPIGAFILGRLRARSEHAF